MLLVFSYSKDEADAQRSLVTGLMYTASYRGQALIPGSMVP